jgi:hypothetical protein
MEVWPNTSLCRSRSCTQLVWVSGSNPEIRVLRISYWEISECRHSYETGAIPLPNFDSASYRAKGALLRRGSRLHTILREPPAGAAWGATSGGNDSPVSQH